METTLKPYLAYRDSGLPWIGRVPEHWEVTTFGQIGRFFKGNGGNKLDEVPDGVPCVRYGDLYTQYKYMIGRTRSCVTRERASSYTPIAYGDILFAASGETIGEIGKSAVNLMEMEARCGGDVLVFRPSRKVVPCFMGYASDCPSAMWQKACMGRGFTVMHIYGSQLKGLRIALPSLSEQTAIARYLDHVGERIDRYVSAKHRLIVLLNEKRQAIVDRAVTRGLDPNAPMKPTGVEWMPEVPAHWETPRLKTCVLNVVDMTNERGPDDIYVALEHIQSWTGKIVDEDLDTVFESQVKRFRSYDVLFGKLRPYQAKATRPGRKGVCVGEFLVLRPREGRPLSSYLMLWLLSKPVIDAIDASTFGAKMPRADWQFIGNMRFPFPPITEQTAIVEYLDQATAEIDTAINRARRQIDLAHEYRERLINDVVTGKLDVRDARVDTVPDADALEEAGQAPMRWVASDGAATFQ